LRSERLAAALLLMAAPAIAPPALADPVKIAIVHASSADPLARRARAELVALGLEVVDITTAGDTPPDDAELDRAARLAGAAAAIRIIAPSTSVWIAGNGGDEYVIRAVPADDTASPSPDAVSVLRAVEVVRAALLESPAPAPAPPVVTRKPPSPAPTVSIAPPPADTPTRPPQSRLTLELAPAVAGAPGGVPPSASLLVGARWMPGPLGPAAFVVIPIFPAHLDGIEGSAAVRAAVVGAGLHFAPGPREASLHPGIEAGLAGVWLLIGGAATTGYIGRSDNLLAAAPYIRAGLSLAISPQVALRADFLGAVTLSEPVITFAGRQAATWGRPILLGSGGLEISLF
jgi:hypothetical protein